MEIRTYRKYYSKIYPTNLIISQLTDKIFPNNTSCMSESPCGVLEINKTVRADVKAYRIPMIASCFNRLSRILMKDINKAPTKVKISGMEVSPVPIKAAKATP